MISNMFLVKLNHGNLPLFMYLLCLFNVTKSNTINWEPVSTYPHMDEYNLNIINPERNCLHFQCELSVLNTVEISMLILEENENRREYAQANAVSNMYRVFWDHRLAQYALMKAQLCLPPSVTINGEYYHIYDNQAIQFLFSNRDTLLQLPVTMQVVIGQRTYNKNISVTPAFFKSQLFEYYPVLFSSNSESLKRRGATTLMGCGYVYQNLTDEFRDNLICIYGVLYYGNYSFNANTGKECSDCISYFQNKYEDPDVIGIDHVSKWACDLKHPFLCSDLDRTYYKPKESDARDILFDCKNPKAGFRADIGYGKLIVEKKNRTKITEAAMPCWFIMVPLLIIITILLAACTYHASTAFLTYRQIKLSKNAK